MARDWTQRAARAWGAFRQTMGERGARLRAEAGPWVQRTSSLAARRFSAHFREMATDATRLWAGFVRQSNVWSHDVEHFIDRSERYIEQHAGTALSAYLSAASRGLADYRRQIEPRLSPAGRRALNFAARTLGHAFSLPRFRQSTLAVVSGALVMVLVVTGAASVPRDYARKPNPQVPLPSRLARPPAKPPAELAKAYATEPVISIYLDSVGAVTYLPMEAYLAGVLAGEMDSRAPVEAFAAQAIVARTVALKAIVEKGTPWQLHRTDVCTSPAHLQAYRPSAITADMKRAVSATRGQVLTYGNELVSAVFASCCGGRTAAVQESYPSEPPTPYLKSVPCPCAEFAPDTEYHWRVRLPLWEVGSFLDKPTSAVSDVRITGRGPSGRVTQMTAGGRTFSGADLRNRFGSDFVRSTLVDTFSVSGSYIYASGRGWGHGVGLCQWGAFTLARKGWKSADITAYYYGGTDLIKLWK